MKLLLMADGLVGTAICDWLIQTWPEDIGLVVTTADNAIREKAQYANRPTTVFSNERELVDTVAALGVDFDLGLLAWWPRIIGEVLLRLPVQGYVNTHPSLLPYNRGKHYNFWALVEQSPFGVTLHRVDKGVDTGAIIVQRQIHYTWEDTGASLYHKAAAAMIELVKEAYPHLRQLDLTSTAQRQGEGSFHRASELEEASHIFLDRQYSARTILNLLRARSFSPHPACWFKDGDEEYEVRIEIKKRTN